MVWPDGIPSVIPLVDRLIVVRQAMAPQRLFRRIEDRTLLAWQDAQPIFDRYGSRQPDDAICSTTIGHLTRWRALFGLYLAAIENSRWSARIRFSIASSWRGIRADLAVRALARRVEVDTRELMRPTSPR